jgi:hypothetical protein
MTDMTFEMEIYESPRCESVCFGKVSAKAEAEVESVAFRISGISRMVMVDGQTVNGPMPSLAAGLETFQWRGAIARQRQHGEPSLAADSALMKRQVVVLS